MTHPSRLLKYEPYLRSILRIVAGFMFMLHGTGNLFGFPSGQPVELASMMGIAGLIETVGGALLLLGLFTRPVAFVASGLMASAYFMAHAPKGFWPTENGGVSAALYCFVWLYFVAAGAGPISLDRLGARGGADPIAPH